MERKSRDMVGNHWLWYKDSQAECTWLLLSLHNSNRNRSHTHMPHYYTFLCVISKLEECSCSSRFSMCLIRFGVYVYVLLPFVDRTFLPSRFDLCVVSVCSIPLSNMLFKFGKVRRHLNNHTTHTHTHVIYNMFITFIQCQSLHTCYSSHRKYTTQKSYFSKMVFFVMCKDAGLWWWWCRCFYCVY